MNYETLERSPGFPSALFAVHADPHDDGELICRLRGTDLDDSLLLDFSYRVWCIRASHPDFKDWSSEVKLIQPEVERREATHELRRVRILAAPFGGGEPRELVLFQYCRIYN